MSGSLEHHTAESMKVRGAQDNSALFCTGRSHSEQGAGGYRKLENITVEARTLTHLNTH